MRANAMPFLVSAALYRMRFYPWTLPQEPNGHDLPGCRPPGYLPPLELGEQPYKPNSDEDVWGIE